MSVKLILVLIFQGIQNSLNYGNQNENIISPTSVHHSTMLWKGLKLKRCYRTPGSGGNCTVLKCDPVKEKSCMVVCMKITPVAHREWYYLKESWCMAWLSRFALTGGSVIGYGLCRFRGSTRPSGSLSLPAARGSREFSGPYVCLHTALLLSMKIY